MSPLLALSSASSHLVSSLITGLDRTLSSRPRSFSSSSLRLPLALTTMVMRWACSTCWLRGVFLSVSALEVSYEGSRDAWYKFLAQTLMYLFLPGEYPAGSVGCAESSGELKRGTRNRWFILFTNSMIDVGFVIGAFIPCTCASLSRSVALQLSAHRLTPFF